MTEKKKFAVIGDPIAHSLSPVMHNAVFSFLGLDCTYEAIRVPAKDLGARFKEMESEFSGINVTIPHKIGVITYLDGLDGIAKSIGAVNTVKIENGKATGYNTDGIGAVMALEDECGDIKKKNVLLLGAGGAARAIAFACAQEKAEVSIWNRTIEKAISLAKEVGGSVCLDLNILDEFDVIINSTSVGMTPNVNEALLEAGQIPKNSVVMDIVYNPLETQLLKEAEKAGARTIDGVEMFVNQGRESLRVWLGIDAPKDLMRKAVLEMLDNG
ncbi:MAG: shikimate dehydrogenase [Candidatus Altiarchaeota archaeon]|nr:shikimate dehydrogenase [Candidatus Altiarchaeota archaeon]